ncbi:MAG: phosphohydrolase [Chitinophagaceae bacterium]|nr:phosphohydrolase [Chitinophagaceae bacterium]
MYTELTDEAGNYVSSYTKAHADANLLYHNIRHTENVVAAAIQISNHYQLSDEDFFIVVTAAWFHDLGYYTGKTTGHEQAGADLAEKYLIKKGTAETVVEKVKGCIMATVMPQTPGSLLEKIVCDADLFHLGGSDFFERSKLLRKETELIHGKHIGKDEWRASSIVLLQSHQYQTDYCRMLLNDTKMQNLEELLQKQSKNGSVPVTETGVAELSDGKKEKSSGQPGRGIETMFRITSTNNQRLSDMADNKAQILITVNSIILSAIISLVLRKLEENSFLTYPSFTLLAVSLVTIVISIIATRPSIPPGMFTKNDIDEKKVNLLFFGNFYKMKLSEYEEGMRAVMSDNDFLYGTLIKDVYAQGVVLGRKYRLLRLAYTVFMFGLVVSVLGYIAVFLIWK